MTKISKVNKLSWFKVTAGERTQLPKFQQTPVTIHWLWWNKAISIHHRVFVRQKPTEKQNWVVFLVFHTISFPLFLPSHLNSYWQLHISTHFLKCQYFHSNHNSIRICSSMSEWWWFQIATKKLLILSKDKENIKHRLEHIKTYSKIMFYVNY